MQELEKILEEIDREETNALLSEHTTGYKAGALNMTNTIRDIIRKHMNDGWIPVEERLPDKEADKFIKEKLDGIGYLYPCLLTYRSPNTERIHVVRFYYDVDERWFVNAGEELCDKDRCIAWRPLPEPYRPERSEK